MASSEEQLPWTVVARQRKRVDSAPLVFVRSCDVRFLRRVVTIGPHAVKITVSEAPAMEAQERELRFMRSGFVGPVVECHAS